MSWQRHPFSRLNKPTAPNTYLGPVLQPPAVLATLLWTHSSLRSFLCWGSLVQTQYVEVFSKVLRIIDSRWLWAMLSFIQPRVLLILGYTGGPHPAHCTPGLKSRSSQSCSPAPLPVACITAGLCHFRDRIHHLSLQNFRSMSVLPSCPGPSDTFQHNDRPLWLECPPSPSPDHW